MIDFNVMITIIIIDIISKESKSIIILVLNVLLYGSQVSSIEFVENKTTTKQYKSKRMRNNIQTKQMIDKYVVGYIDGALICICI